MQLEVDAFDVGIPLFLVACLLPHLDGVLVLVVVSEESVDVEAVLEAHRERLSLEWEVHEDILFLGFGELEQEFFKLFRLSFLNALWDNNHALLELLLLHVDVVVLEVDDAEGLEGWVTWAGCLDPA